MNWMDFMTGASVGLLAWWGLEKIDQLLRKAKKIPPPAYDPKDVALNSQPAKPQSDWYSLPGGRLELGDTGFYITLNPAEPGKVYQGFTPENYRVVWGNDLASMKRYLEGEARGRAEFTPPSNGWKP
jgi:hypothetical protein